MMRYNVSYISGDDLNSYQADWESLKCPMTVKFWLVDQEYIPAVMVKC